MPQLTLPITPQGPLLDILIAVSGPRKDALTANNQPVPTYQRAKALIDSGASCTCIDSAILNSLNLTPTGVIHVHTPSTQSAPHAASQFDVSLVLVHPQSTFTFPNIPVIESHLAIQGIQALLGRDVLMHCLLVYNGATNTYTLAF